MTVADFWAWLLVGVSTLAAARYAYLTWRSRGNVPLMALALGGLIVLVCTYPAVLWGGQIIGQWTITPDLGRPALVFAMAALLWLSILAYDRKS